MMIVRVPIRISFGGGGTDLAAYYGRFGGFVVSASITRYCHVILHERMDNHVRISSADYHTWEEYALHEAPSLKSPLALPRAALGWFVERGALKTGVDLFLASEVPPGTGLGSSSAMAVALVRALATHSNLPLSSMAVAELACELEIERLHMPIGKQDQYASALGGLNSIEFTPDNVRVTPLALPADIISSLNARLLLFATGQARHAADILGQQQADTHKQPKTVTALHRIKALAHEIQDALLAGNLDLFGRLLDLGWHEKKHLSARVSSSMIDQWYETALQAGALGGKITGAGGGGFLLFYCPPERQQAVRAALAACGLQEMPFDFDFAGPQILANHTHAEFASALVHTVNVSLSK